ncbi:hypothetical protein PROFUN_05240 [Planoprotostelium fungivorum]|uniref:Uncharacterized protein n=1 Tax=Planoprotostelium fungivorum TaxID=1890364 RepID=A0A2P6NRK0_9EUKA|nr:hypothetical protein PROFUN_05240 [Planoprotostelium fungivorum]
MSVSIVEISREDNITLLLLPQYISSQTPDAVINHPYLLSNTARCLRCPPPYIQGLFSPSPAALSLHQSPLDSFCTSTLPRAHRAWWLEDQQTPKPLAIEIRRNMKRQKCERSYGFAEEAALKILLTSERATVAIAFPIDGPPEIRLINDRGRELLTPLLDESSSVSGPAASFWKSIDYVVKGGKTMEGNLLTPKGQLRIKYRRTVLEHEAIVVATAKKVDGTKEKEPRLQLVQSRQTGSLGYPIELSPLVNALEEDIVGRVLGTNQLQLCIIKFHQERGVHQYLATNDNLARFLKFDNAYELRGKTTIDLNMMTADGVTVRDQFYGNLNPQTKTASFSLDLLQYQDTTFYCAFREVIPEVILGITIVHRRTIRPAGPKPPTVPRLTIPKVWIRNRWDEFMEDCLHYIHENQSHATQDRMKLPEEFLKNTQKVYCYAYHGYQGFLPSGDSDGYRWKSSRGTCNTGNLQRKYFYTDLPDGRKLRRRVMWLEGIPGIYIVEYRHFHQNNTEPDQLMGPECMDWPLLLSSIQSQTNRQFTTTVDRISSHFELAEARVNQSELGSGNVLSYVNGILHNWASEYGRVENFSTPSPKPKGTRPDCGSQLLSLHRLTADLYKQ